MTSRDLYKLKKTVQQTLGATADGTLADGPTQGRSDPHRFTIKIDGSELKDGKQYEYKYTVKVGYLDDDLSFVESQDGYTATAYNKLEIGNDDSAPTINGVQVSDGEDSDVKDILPCPNGKVLGAEVSYRDDDGVYYLFEWQNVFKVECADDSGGGA